MEIENSSYGGESNTGKNLEKSTSDYLNGLSNGYSSESKHKSHKSDHKDKHRDKDRERDKNKDRSKSHKSSSKDKDRDRERDRDKNKHRDKDKDRHSSSHKSSSKDKDRDKERSDRDKDRSDRDKDRSDRDKDKHRDKDRDKNRDKEKSSSSHKSSSRDKDRDRERDKDKEKPSSSSKDKDRKDRDKDRSDRDKDKSRHSSSSKDKDRHKEKSSKDKDRHSSSSSKDKDRHKDKDKYEKSEVKVKEEVKEEVKVEIEEAEPEVNGHDEVHIKKEEPDNSYEEKDINVSAASSCDYNLSSFKTEPELEESDEDVPLASRRDEQKIKRKIESEDEDDDVPLTARKKPKTEEKKKKKRAVSSEEEDDYPVKKRKEKKKVKKEVKKEVTEESPNKKRKKGQGEEQEVWKWWEEEKKDDGTKWSFLEHKGPVFAPPYEPLPSNVKFYYDGKEIKLSQDTEEVAGFYAKMLDHDYTTKDIFNENFFSDWRKCMNEKEKSTITDLKKCNFKSMHAYFMDIAEQNRNRSKEEKKALKEKNEELIKEYGFCKIDGHKEKIGNFKIEPPGLFRGRGEHPKMGKLKRRVMPEDISINCSKDSKSPEPPKGHKWKDVRHDPNVTWLASWTENVQNQVKYIMLNPSSKLKGEKDMQKYETARRLHKQIDKIRSQYKEDWKSKEMRIRQRAVALYFIDKLALRAGNEKDEDQADTVGCCSLRVEHIELHEEKDGRNYVVVFDFLGKDSIRYYNEVPVEKRVFKNLQLFMENKNDGDDLFDRLNTAILNKHLTELMDGLTAKVFRTYNASSTLQDQLDLLTNEDDSIAEKILSYNRANRAVAILCNHQRSVPKGHEKSMEKLKEKIDQKREHIAEMQKQVKDAAKDAKHGSVKEKMICDKKKKGLERLKDQLKKLEVQETDRDENKTIALGTSKLNYLDPRISVAWCKKYDVPIEKIFNKTQRDKFRWAIDMAGPDYRF